MVLLSFIIPLRILWFLLLFYIWISIYVSLSLQGKVFVAPKIWTDRTGAFPSSDSAPQMHTFINHAFLCLLITWLNDHKQMHPHCAVPFCFHLKLKLWTSWSCLPGGCLAAMWESTFPTQECSWGLWTTFSTDLKQDSPTEVSGIQWPWDTGTWSSGRRFI